MRARHLMVAAGLLLLPGLSHARQTLGPGGCVQPPKLGLKTLRSLNKQAFRAQQRGAMTRKARHELTIQAATIFKALNHPGAGITKAQNGVDQLSMLGQLTRRVRYAPEGRMTQIGLRSMRLHGQQLRFQAGGRLIGTSESFVELVPGASTIPGVKTTRTAPGSSGQFETRGQPLLPVRPTAGPR